VLASLTNDGVYVGIVKKRMAKGTKISGIPPVDVFVFDCSQGDFLDPDAFMGTSDTDEADSADEDK
jgi:hypothetical protein